MESIEDWEASMNSFIRFLHEYGYLNVERRTFRPERNHSPEYLRLQRGWSDSTRQGDAHVSLKIHLAKWYMKQTGIEPESTEVPEIYAKFYDCFETYCHYGRADVKLDESVYGEAGDFDWYRLIRAFGFYFKNSFYHNWDTRAPDPTETIVYTYTEFEEHPALYERSIRTPVDTLYHLPYEAQTEQSCVLFKISKVGEWPPTTQEFREYKKEHNLSYDYTPVSDESPRLSV